MSKVALLNAKVYRYYSDAIETTNLLLINGILAGTGYIPDDDDSEHIDLKGKLIIPDSTLILPKGISDEVVLNTLPFTNIALPLSSNDIIHRHTTYALLDTDELQPNPTQPVTFYGIAGLSSENTDHHTILFQLAKNAEKPIIVSDDGYELEYMLDQQKTTPFHLHVCCKNIQTIYKLRDQQNCTFSVDLSLLTHPKLIDLLQKETCKGFSLYEPMSDISFLSLFNTLPELDICRLFSKKPLDLFSATPSQLKLNSKPTLKVLDPLSNPIISRLIENGIPEE